ncbi:OLC1v1032459C1 [Oldenlandia corymbosa var. corymbosa]|uniref:OLC1v1032459C1 n=1 Tax=Oldenlandia corymbosa var. corymbosa TaxID=529605 RepID=A0AAV1CMW1_OLDCO|nr:OLC1v1032459C1 [Oldenlandia corymbosa var. corymbosa]
MYVARRLSEYIETPDALSVPPDGPNSGFLVIQDEDSETYSCFGSCKNHRLKDLPFPQNKKLTFNVKQGKNDSPLDIFFIPVLNLPLSCNRYYAIQPHGKHKGEAFTSSREEDMATFCFCRRVKEIKPKPLDPRNVYQQFEICVCENSCATRGLFYAKSVAPDGCPPYFMRSKGWSGWTKTPKNYQLDEAPGLDASLRARQPDFNFAPTYKTSEAVVVGEWYSPFMFVKEGAMKLKDQLKRSPFYQVTLEQQWEQIFSCRNQYCDGKSVTVDVNLDGETVYVAGNRAEWVESNVVDGVIWFRSRGNAAGKETKVGLTVELVQRVKWEQERGRWKAGKERQLKVERTEQYQGNGGWKEFGCYVLVESFVIRRMDGPVVMNWDFRHIQHIKSIWQ